MSVAISIRRDLKTLGAQARKDPKVQLRELFAKVGSSYPVYENLRLTPEVEAAFTEYGIEALRAPTKVCNGSGENSGKCRNKIDRNKDPQPAGAR